MDFLTEQRIKRADAIRPEVRTGRFVVGYCRIWQIADAFDAALEPGKDSLISMYAWRSNRTGGVPNSTELFWLSDIRFSKIVDADDPLLQNEQCAIMMADGVIPALRPVECIKKGKNMWIGYEEYGYPEEAKLHGKLLPQSRRATISEKI